jgi:hypothetical protein
MTASVPDADAPAEDTSMEVEGDSIIGVKRKADEQEDEEEEEEEEAPSNALKVNADGTVEQEDKVKCVVLSKFIHFFYLNSHNYFLGFGKLGIRRGTINKSSVYPILIRNSLMSEHYLFPILLRLADDPFLQSGKVLYRRTLMGSPLLLPGRMLSNQIKHETTK